MDARKLELSWTKPLVGKLVDRALRPCDPPEMRPALHEHTRRCLDLLERFVEVERVRRS